MHIATPFYGNITGNNPSNASIRRDDDGNLQRISQLWGSPQMTNPLTQDDIKGLVEKLKEVSYGRIDDTMNYKGYLMQQAAQALENSMWRTNTEKPLKPGKSNYEYVDCWIYKDGVVFHRPWNCEHECFDDTHYDDWYCNMEDVDAWMPRVKPSPPKTE